MKLKITERRLKKYNIKYTVFAGVNGYLRSNLTKYENYLDKCKTQKRDIVIRTPGAYGYMQSWKNIIIHAKKNNYKNFLLFEDDVIFHKSFEKEIDIYLDKIKTIDWYVLYIGASEYGVINNKNNGLYKPTSNTNGSFAVAINSCIYDELLCEIKKLKTSFDSGPLQTIYERHPNKCYIVHPNLIIADVTKSSILYDRNMFYHAKKMDWNLTNYNLDCFKLKLSIILYVNNSRKTIYRCLDSLLNQTYINKEIIIVDNNSEYSLKKLCRSFSNKYNEVSFVNLVKDYTYNRCIDICVPRCTGDLITVVNSNEISLSYRFEKMISTMLINDEEKIKSKTIKLPFDENNINDLYLSTMIERSNRTTVNSQPLFYKNIIDNKLDVKTYSSIKSSSYNVGILSITML